MKFRAILFLTALVFLLGCMGHPESVNEKYIAKHHNKLDDVNTVADIQKLLTAIDTDFAGFKVDDSLKYRSQFNNGENEKNHTLALKLKVQPWVKTDFDGNGYTDMLLVGNWYDHSVLAILDSGENRFYIKMITRRSFQETTFPVLTMLDGIPAILNHTKEGSATDTLVFQFGDFVEFHAVSAKHKIEKIEYSTSPCFGTCPIFSMNISSDRKATYIGQNYNYPDGEYNGTIDSIHYYTLTTLLNYINFNALDTNYSVNWTDDQSCTLIITYDGGKIKKIDDYGLIGTYGLSRVYDILFSLRDDQKWYDKSGKMKVPEKKERGAF
ncbi:MAG: DUF6438 domain-containing protein [Bacteroidia bacterium]